MILPQQFLKIVVFDLSSGPTAGVREQLLIVSFAWFPSLDQAANF